MSAQTLYSVHNAARLLCAFQAADTELGVTELARRLGLAKSVVYRMLRTLMVEGLIEQDVETGGYRLGIKLWELGCLVSSHAELHRAATIVVDELHNRTGDSVHVAVLDGVEVVYVERREAQRTLDPLGEVGHRNYAHSTATGKVLLAFLPPAELDRRLARAQLAPRGGDPAAVHGGRADHGRGDLGAARLSPGPGGRRERSPGLTWSGS